MAIGSRQRRWAAVIYDAINVLCERVLRGGRVGSASGWLAIKEDGVVGLWAVAPPFLAADFVKPRAYF